MSGDIERAVTVSLERAALADAIRETYGGPLDAVGEIVRQLHRAGWRITRAEEIPGQGDLLDSTS